MVSITRATVKDDQLLSLLAKQSLLESHAHSPGAAGLHTYADENYSEAALKAELGDEKNIYHIIYHNNQPAGYSKVIFDMPFTQSEIKNITKLERLYLLEQFYGLALGRQLLNFNLELAKRNNQSGMWLYTWKENHRAIKFYTKNGFIIIGSYDFKITEDLINPNHQMLLEF
jgi:GNAT superfamily N-acetyltransferase